MQSFGVPNKIKQDPLVNAKVSGSEINIQMRITCRQQQKKKKPCSKTMLCNIKNGLVKPQNTLYHLMTCNLSDVAIEIYGIFVFSVLILGENLWNSDLDLWSMCKRANATL